MKTKEITKRNIIGEITIKRKQNKMIIVLIIKLNDKINNKNLSFISRGLKVSQSLSIFNTSHENILIEFN